MMPRIKEKSYMDKSEIKNSSDMFLYKAKIDMKNLLFPKNKLK